MHKTSTYLIPAIGIAAITAIAIGTLRSPDSKSERPVAVGGTITVATSEGYSELPIGTR